MKKIFFITVAIVLALYGNPITHADSGALEGASGGSLKSYNDDNIQMVEETININIVDQGSDFTITPHAHVQVDYTFKNTTDKPVTVTTGFPERDQGEPLTGFTALINGKKVTATKQPGQEITDPITGNTYTEYWYTYTLNFTPGESLEVTNIYNQDAIGGEGSKGYYATYPYILDTGATWKDNIQSVKFIVNLTNMDIHNISSLQPVYPNNLWQVSNSGKTLSLTLHNVKPTTQDNFNLTSSSETGNNANACNWKVDDIHQVDNPDVATSTSTKSPDINTNISASYFPCEAFDNDPKTAWVTADGQNPIGQSITYSLHTALGRVFDSVFVDGGLQDSGNGMNVGLNYMDYSRPKTIKLNFISATTTLYSSTLTIPDNASGTAVSLPDKIIFSNRDNWAPVEANIEILDVYPGNKYKNLAINELSLQSYPGNTFVETTQPKTFNVPGQIIDTSTANTSSTPIHSITAPVNNSSPSPTAPPGKKNWWITFGILGLFIIFGILCTWKKISDRKK